MELYFLVLLVAIMVFALTSGFPVAFALPGSAIVTIAIAAFCGWVFEGNVDAYFAIGGPNQWLSAGVTNYRSLYWVVERDTLIATVRRLTDFESPRGLPRANIERPVEITARGRRVEGTVRNVSRGGLFVDAPLHFSKEEEVGLHFSLDGGGEVVSPTAQVVWSQPTPEGTDRVGLRFLEIPDEPATAIRRFVSSLVALNEEVGRHI